MRWSGGLQVAAPLVDLVPGQASSGVRVVEFTAADGGWLLEVEGEAGRSYDLRLFGGAPAVTEVLGAIADVRAAGGGGGGAAGPATSSSSAARPDAHVLRVRFPEGAGRRLAAVRLRPGGE